MAEKLDSSSESPAARLLLRSVADLRVALERFAVDAAIIGAELRRLGEALTELRPASDVEGLEPSDSTGCAELASLADFAKRCGVSRSTVFKWRRVGLPVVVRGRVVRVDVRAADEWLRSDAVEHQKADVARRAARAHAARGVRKRR